MKENIYLRIKKYAPNSLWLNEEIKREISMLKSNKNGKHKTKNQWPSKGSPQRKFMAYNILIISEERLKSKETKDLP